MRKGSVLDRKIEFPESARWSIASAGVGLTLYWLYVLGTAYGAL